MAGVPMPILHQTISQSNSRKRQYSAEATRVLGTVAGSGDATATNPGKPSRLSNGVATALPPFPKRPPRNPMIAPVRRAPRCCQVNQFLPLC